ncbi:MAG: pentapeptide repeat-containing protein [Leptolyngbyaceae cyanobacterium MO_188.B28]|nr:pentapeptide repeat-containing protein [Leptolyngbyaceae cyanobacterium MO_188.B28]
MAWKWKRRIGIRKSREEQSREQIERVAYLVYKNRVVTGKQGDARSDWEKAEKIVQIARSRTPVIFWRSLLRWANTPRLGAKPKEPKERILRRFADWWESTPVEKTLEDIEHILKNSALLSIVNLAAGVTIIVSLVVWWTGREERRENELFATWTVIHDGVGDKSGVVRVAVERLLRNGFSLKGLNLSGTDLYEANLQGAFLWEANLQGAYLWWANLEGATLSGADLQGATLLAANLQGADLWRADLQGANLNIANLQDANLFYANLEGANLGRANLQGANLWSANLSGAQNLTKEQLTQAKLCETNFPEDITLNPNRNCEELKRELQERLNSQPSQ